MRAFDNLARFRGAVLAALSLILLAPLASAATATLERVAGQPVIYEIGDAGARRVSLANVGAEYRLPIEVETGAGDSAQFRLPDSTVQVAPGTIMRIAAPELREGGLFQRILQKAGSSLFAVDRRQIEHFEVETPYLVSVVKGTTFNVVVHDAGATVALHEGRLLVSSPDGARQVELFPGDVAYSGRDGMVEKLSHHQARSDGVAVPGEAGEAGSPASSGALALGVAGAQLAMIDTVDAVQRASGAATEGGLLPSTGTGASVGDAAGDVAQGVGGVTQDVGGTVAQDVGGAVGDAAGDVVQDVGGAVGDVADTTGDLVQDVGDSVGDVAGQVADTTGDLAGDLGDLGDDLDDLDDLADLDDDLLDDDLLGGGLGL